MFSVFMCDKGSYSEVQIIWEHSFFEDKGEIKNIRPILSRIAPIGPLIQSSDILGSSYLCVNVRLWKLNVSGPIGERIRYLEETGSLKVQYITLKGETNQSIFSQLGRLRPNFSNVRSDQ